MPDAIKNSHIYNTGPAVAQASNKLKFFQAMSRDNHRNPPRCVPWTASKPTAAAWLENGDKVVARTVLTGHSGKGIIIYNKPEPIQEAPLYTKYIPKKEEYRVHFFSGKIIDVQKKVLKKLDIAGNPVDPKKINWLVRNLDNGFVYARDNVVAPKDVTNQAKLLIQCTSLDFGAIDIIFCERDERAYVLEVNTAPGLAGSTVQSYGDRIIEILGLNI